MFTRKYSNYIVAAIVVLSSGGDVYARQPVDQVQRLAAMDREMNCIMQSYDGAGELPWRDSCASDGISGGYDIARYEKPAQKSYGAMSKRLDLVPLVDSRELSSPGVFQLVGNAWDSSGTHYERSRPPTVNPDFSGYNPLDMPYAPYDDLPSGRFVQGYLGLMGGYRIDDFDWNTAADITGSATPNILSELTWSDLKMTQIMARGGIILGNRWVVDGVAAYADVYKGDNQDSDYSGNNRTIEFSRSNNKSDDGNAYDWSAGAGYRFRFGSDREGLLGAEDIWFTPMAGYSYHELNLIMTDGFQTIPATGSFPKLHSSYWAQWDGPWTGFELHGSLSKLSGTFRFEYHWADYYGSANWNLRTDFQHPKSYEHVADDALGLVFRLGMGYRLTDNWTLDFQADIQEWKAEDGIDRTFFSSGATIETLLNEVNWESKAFMFGSTFRF